jgi:hypothetical protein
MPYGQHLKRWQQVPPKALIIDPKDTYRQMNVAALQHCGVINAMRLDRPHLHARIPYSVTPQERREHVFDHLWRGRDLEHASITSAERLRSFADRGGMAQQTAAVREELIAFAGKEKTAANALEELDSQLVLKVPELSRYRRLGNAQK